MEANQLVQFRSAFPSTASTSLFLRRDLSEQAMRRPVDPMFSQRDLDNARGAGFTAGHKAGLEDAAKTQAAAEIRILDAIAVAMTESQTEAARIADAAAAALAKSMVAAMNAVMPELIRRSAIGEAGAMLAHVLPGLAREPQVCVEVATEIAGGIEAAIARLSLGHRERIAVVGVEGVQPSDVRVLWGSGKSYRQPNLIWQSVTDVLERALDGNQPKDGNNGN